jgi:phosphoglycolate phosphatase-like HAD superfamily hydrolase
LKLDSLGLSESFSFGAFGSDHADRNRLLPIACERYQSLTGITVPFERCTVIGDTPHDVKCSHVHGGRALAVATGRHSTEELARTGADVVLRDLSDVDSALGFLLGTPPARFESS